MTETEWFTATDSSAMQLCFQQLKVSDRKIRLFRVACCIHFWANLTIKPAREAVKAAEGYADGLVSVQQLEKLYRQGFARFSTYSRMKNIKKASREPQFGKRIEWAAFAIDTLAVDLAGHFPVTRGSMIYGLLDQIPPELLRDVFGNPFRPVTVEPEWQTSTVVAIADGIYTEKAFDRLPILADALQDAGCENKDITNHLRTDGPHFKGCWALDLVLGKS